MTGVLLVDDHPVIVMACRQLLEDSGVVAIAEAYDAVNGYQAYLHNKPDVIVIDLSLRGEELGGLLLIERIRAHDPNARILVFSIHADPSIVASAIDAGATGYLLKDALPDEFPRAVKQVQSGHRYIDEQLALKVALLRAERERPRIDPLTPREREVLGLLAEGKPYATIVDQLGISYKTVINVTYRLRRKLGATGLSDLIRRAVEMTRGKP
jgi:DNA-binding NarL/FixJ family response regulator